MVAWHHGLVLFSLSGPWTHGSIVWGWSTLLEACQLSAKWWLCLLFFYLPKISPICICINICINNCILNVLLVMFAHLWVCGIVSRWWLWLQSWDQTYFPKSNNCLSLTAILQHSNGHAKLFLVAWGLHRRGIKDCTTSASLFSFVEQVIVALTAVPPRVGEDGIWGSDKQILRNTLNIKIVC